MLFRPWLIDGLLASALLAAAVVVVLAYGVRVSWRGRIRDDRLTRYDSSLLFGQWLMEAGYWSFRPLGRVLAQWRVSADSLSWASLVSGVVAGVAVALGHLGWAAATAAVSALFDALDGMVARCTGSASDAGEVLDAAVDRYVEFAFLAGCALHLRDSPGLLGLALAALLGTFMVSYSTAKAEARAVELPSASMRRPVRAVYLTAGAALAAVLTGVEPRAPWGQLPLTLALALVAVTANVSAARRLYLLATTVRRNGTLTRIEPSTASPAPPLGNSEAGDGTAAQAGCRSRPPLRRLGESAREASRLARPSAQGRQGADVEGSGPSSPRDHAYRPPASPSSFFRLWVACSLRTVPDLERMTSE